MTARGLAAIALTGGLLIASAGAAAAEGPLRQRLPSGLTLLVRENSATPVVAVSFFVRMGSRWETESDAGIVMIRRRLLEEVRRLEAGGGDPKATIRDERRNDRIRLPYADRSYNAVQRAGRIHMSADEHTPPGAPLYGQPEEIIAEMRKLWGALR